MPAILLQCDRYNPTAIYNCRVIAWANSDIWHSSLPGCGMTRKWYITAEWWFELAVKDAFTVGWIDSPEFLILGLRIGSEKQSPSALSYQVMVYSNCLFWHSEMKGLHLALFVTICRARSSGMASKYCTVTAYSLRYHGGLVVVFHVGTIGVSKRVRNKNGSHLDYF